jgi:NAD(P)-dependent dehydrogenase (short-subunit alcohol dehydrogenase family)
MASATGSLDRGGIERGESAAKELAGDGDVLLVSLDVTDAESVRAVAVRVGT